MIKILQIGMDNCLGGIEVFVYNVFKNIDKSKYHFDFISSSEQQICFEDEFIKMGCKVYRVTSRKQNLFKNINEINSIIKNGKYDIIHWNAMSLSNNIAAMLGIKNKIPVIVHTHSIWHSNNLTSLLLHKMNNCLLPKKKIIKFACSDDAGKYLFKKDFKVIDNGIDLNKFKYNEANRKKIRKELKISDDVVVIGHIGRLNYAKNHDFLLDVYKEYSKSNNNSLLVIVGSGELESTLKEKASVLGINKKIKFLGNKQNTNELLSMFDLFVFPSKFEGLGIAVIEAQVSGLNCIISDRIPNEAIVSNKVKVLSLSEHPKKWATEMLNCNTDDREFDISSKKIKKFDIVNTTKEIEKTYDEITKKGNIIYE